MYRLTVNEAITLVRKNLDELMANASDMLVASDKDGENLDKIISMTLPQAVNNVHTMAPAYLLDGERMSTSDLQSCRIEDGMLEFSVPQLVLRLVRFRAADSNIVLDEFVSETSFMGLMQLNPYTRGTADNPTLVLCAGGDCFRYFSLETEYERPCEAIAEFEYLPIYFYSEETTAYNVAERIVDKVISQLTGLVLNIMGNYDASDYFLQMAMSFEVTGK